MDEGNLGSFFFQVMFQLFHRQISEQAMFLEDRTYFFLCIAQITFRILPPDEGVAVRLAFQLDFVDENLMMFRLSHIFKFFDILEKEILQSFRSPASPETGDRRIVRSRAAIEEPHEIDSFPAGFFQFS